MFGMGNGSKDDERWWNLIILNIYATDEEISDMTPYIIGGVIILVIILVIFHYF